LPCRLNAPGALAVRTGLVGLIPGSSTRSQTGQTPFMSPTIPSCQKGSAREVLDEGLLAMLETGSRMMREARTDGTILTIYRAGHSGA
jgi:hypothetical protein